MSDATPSAAEQTVARLDGYTQEQHRAGIDAARERMRRRRSQEWWVCEGGFISQGGRKKMGPFPTLDLAIEVRALVEFKEKRADLFVSSLDD